MRVASPDLLTIDDEIIAILDRACLHSAEIRARARIRVPLAPNLVTAENTGNAAFLLLFCAPVHDCWTNDIDAQHVSDARSAYASHLLLINGLLDKRRAAPAILLWPMDADQV